MNFNVKLNLSKLRKVKYLQKAGEIYICIPVKANQIFNGKKGFYLELTAFELKNKQYNESHLLKLSVPKLILEKMTKEQKEQLPIVGSLSEFGGVKIDENNSIVASEFDEVPKNVVENEDDLPF